MDEDLEPVEDDPDDDDDGLHEDVPRRAEEPGDALGTAAERVGAERRLEVLVLPVVAEGILAHGEGIRRERPFPCLHLKRSGR